MIKRFPVWHQRQSPVIKLVLAYFFNALIWLGITLIMDKMWAAEESKSFNADLVKSLFVATIWTLFFDFNKVRNVFKKTGYE